jgi:HK97 family phage portal protein
MGWMERLFGGLGRKDSAVGAMMAVRRVGQPVWSARNYKSFALEGYSQNVIAYRCIRLIVESVAAIPFLIYEGEDELEEHPFLKVLSRPNPWQSGAELIDAFAAYYLISGNGYMEAVDLDGDIRELYALRPDRMVAVAGRRGHPQAWRYSVDGTTKHEFDMDLAPNQQLPIFHMRDFNPLNDYYGLSAIEAAAKSIDVFNSAGAYNKALLDNSASPSGALVYKGTDESDGTLSDDQFRRLKSELEAKHSGTRNAGRPMLLEGGLEWQQMGMSPKDLEFTVGKREAAREIALAFGVPPQLLGIPGDNTYSNYQEANRAFHRQRVLPLMDRICDGLSNWLQPTYEGIRVGYDIDQIDALSIEREAVWSRVKAADFITTDEKREAVGYEPYEAGTTPGSTILVGGAQVPLDDAGFMPGGEEPPAIPDAQTE